MKYINKLYDLVVLTLTVQFRSYHCRYFFIKNNDL